MTPEQSEKLFKVLTEARLEAAEDIAILHWVKTMHEVFRSKRGRDNLLQWWSIWLVDNEPDLHRMRMTHLLGLEKR